MPASAGRRIVRMAVWATLGAAFVVGLRLIGWGPDLTGYLVW